MPLDPVATGDPHVASHNEERDEINQLREDVDHRIVMPNNPKVGAVVRYNGSAWVSSITRIFEGSGQPEGTVAAPVGSRYMQTDGTTGAVEWIKVKGDDENDNTGWSLMFADTKWRNVIGAVSTPGVSEKFVANIRRVNNLVEVYFDLATMNDPGAWTFYTLPSGFRPKFTKYGALVDAKDGAATQNYVSSAGVCSLTMTGGHKRDRWHGSWFTDDPWPTSLPGTALA